jgi:hypothetical protein
MIEVTRITLTGAIESLQTDDPTTALDWIDASADEDSIDIAIHADLDCDTGRVVLRAWANELAGL